MVDIYKIEAGLRNILRRYSIKRAGMDSTVSYQKDLTLYGKACIITFVTFCNHLLSLCHYSPIILIGFSD